MISLRPRPRLPLAVAAIGAALGVALADFFPLPLPWVIATAANAIFIALFFPHTLTALVAITGCFFATHNIRHHADPSRKIAAAISATQRIHDATGIVWNEPRTAGGDNRFFLRGEVTGADGVARDAGMLLVSWPAPPPNLGDRVVLRGSLAAPRGPLNPAEFDEAAWLQRKGVHLVMTANFPADCRVLEHAAARPVMRFAATAREWVRGALLADNAPLEQRALVEGIVLGVTTETPPDLRDTFQETGTLHLLSVSGLNVGMLTLIIGHLLRPLGFGHRALAAISIPVLVLYALVTGLAPSCVRATVMAVFLLTGPCFDRQVLPLNSLAGAAFAILAADTNQLFSPGFQLSFTLVGAIFLIAARIAKKMEPWATPDEFIPETLWRTHQRWRVIAWKIFAAAFGVNIAAWLGSLFFTAGYFNVVSFSAIAVNLVAVVIAFCVLALGLATLLTAFAPPVAALFAGANLTCAAALTGLVSFAAKVPHGHRYVERPSFEQEPACDVTVLALRDGAATHLRAGGENWLLDAGRARDYSRTLTPYLRSRGLNALDALLLTHGDSAHIGGALAVLHDLHPGRWIESPFPDRSPVRRALHAELARLGQGRQLAARGDLWKLADATLEVLYPPSGTLHSNADDLSLVVRLSAAGRSLIFMSDAGFRTERWLLENERDLRADVLVKSWHQDDFSGTLDFIRATGAKLVVAGEMEFGKTATDFNEWARPIRDFGVAVWNQAEAGAVRIFIQRDGPLEARARMSGVLFKQAAHDTQ